MAVVISNGATNIDTVNGFYEVESYNLGIAGPMSPAVQHGLNTLRRWGVTFAHAGNCKGIGLVIGSYFYSATQAGTDIGLQENGGTFTVSIASPGIVTKAGHGFVGGEELILETTGALPTGLTALTTRYYVKYIDANTFNLSLTVGGANINTSGTQSGTHTLWITRTKDTYANSYICTDTNNNARYLLNSIVPFEFTTPYAVDTTASKWKFYVHKNAASVDYWYINTSNATDYAYFTWCDNAKSFTNNDVLICKDRVTINANASIKGILGTGNTVYSYAGIVCRSLTMTEDGISNLVWENPPSASYTFTINGGLWYGGYSGIQIGSSASPIPSAYPAKITFVAPSVGTDTSGIKMIMGSSTSRPSGRNSLILYGEIPSNRMSRLSVDAELSQAHIVLTEDLSALWNTSDRVVIGKQNQKGQGSTTVNTISSFSGADITLNANIATYKRFAGAPVLNLSRQYGIEFKSTSTGSLSHPIHISKPIFLKISGCYFRDCYIYDALYYASYGAYWSTYSVKQEVNDNLHEATQNTTIYFCSVGIISSAGYDLKRNYCFRSNVISTIGAYYVTSFKSGRLLIDSNVMICSYSAVAGTVGSINPILTYSNNEWYGGAGYSYVLLNGRYPIVTNNTFWGSGAAAGANDGALVFGTFCYKPSLSGNTFSNNSGAIGYTSAGLCIEGTSKNDIFGTTVANTYDFRIQAGVLGQFFINSPTGAITVYDTALLDTTDGFKLGIGDDNNVANTDREYLTQGYYVRCGDSLADTTVHTSGTGKFSLRMESIDNGSLEFSQYIPTGDIQGKDMVVGVWCKINSSDYWSATHVMPTLAVDYDDGTRLTATAAESTDWQFLIVPFEPTTTYGRIKVTISCETDQTSTNAYVYWDDFAILYPAGVQLNLGGIDLWAGAEPITPTLATNVSAADVWAYPTASLTASGTTGKQQKDLLTTGKFIALK